MTPIEIIRDISRAKTEKVLRWLYEQEPAETTVFRLSLLFNETVLPTQVQLFAKDLLGAIDITTAERSADEISTLVTRSFEHSVLFLVSPNIFLTHFLSDGYDVIGSSESPQRQLRYLEYYPYYKELIDEWFLAQEYPITTTALGTAIHSIDTAIMQNSAEDVLAEFVEPIFVFLRDLNSEDSHILVNTFLRDKKIFTDISSSDITATTLAQHIKNTINEQQDILIEIPEAIGTEISKEDYTAFISELKEAGVHLPLPKEMRQVAMPATKRRPLPIQLFIDSKLEQKLIEKIFHSNRNEYERMLTMVNNAGSYLESILNLETTLHLQKANRSEKLLSKLESAIKMKFEGGNSTDAIR